MEYLAIILAVPSRPRPGPGPVRPGQRGEALGFALEELPEWQCCGGAYSMGQDEIATKLSSVRALAAARTRAGPGHLCSACHNVLKQVNHEIAVNADMQARANNYMGLDVPYAGGGHGAALSGGAARPGGLRRGEKAVVKPFTGSRSPPTTAACCCARAR